MIIAITQARMTSSRLPGKVLKPILGHPMVWHQMQRTSRAKHLDLSILATSTDLTDDVLADFFIQQGQLVFRGSLNNVLSRYYHCALQYQARHVIRLTADCPLTDPDLIDKVIKTHLEQDNDYTFVSGYPIGMSVEIFKFETLNKAYKNASSRIQKEHVTPFMYQHPELFKIGKVIAENDLSTFRWTVDYPEDFEFVTQIYQALYPHNHDFNFEEIYQFIKQHPELININAHCKQNQI